jgi:hypothetical protein
MRYLCLCLLPMLAACENGSSFYPYYSRGPTPLYNPPPPSYGAPVPSYGAPPPPMMPDYANCGTPDQPKPCTR